MDNELYARQEELAKLQKTPKNIVSEDMLWDMLKVFEGYSFETAKRLGFTYMIKGKEMFISRKEKSVTKATVMIAFRKALELGGNVPGPKKLNCFGASYLYPIFVYFGIIKQE